jgi:PTH1 family peptidyl-tRNA hydrolase
LAREAGASWSDCPEGSLAEIVLDGKEAWLFKARSFVNLTGHDIAALLRRVGGSPEDCVVLIDDLALGLGVSKLKRDGGDGGHKGMRSIVSALATDEILRVRIGVARGEDVTAERKRVLEPFSADDLQALAPGFTRARALLATALAEVIASRDSLFETPTHRAPDGQSPGSLPAV